MVISKSRRMADQLSAFSTGAVTHARALVVVLPVLLREAGVVNVGMNVVQPMGLEGEVKLIVPLTMKNIAEAVGEAKLASPEEIASLVDELYDFAADPRTLGGMPRVIQAWGRRPTE